MSLTIEDLKDKLKQVDSVSLLEILNIESEDLVEAFEERIEQQYDSLVEEFEEENDE